MSVYNNNNILKDLCDEKLIFDDFNNFDTKITYNKNNYNINIEIDIIKNSYIENNMSVNIKIENDKLYTVIMTGVYPKSVTFCRILSLLKGCADFKIKDDMYKNFTKEYVFKNWDELKNYLTELIEKIKCIKNKLCNEVNDFNVVLNYLKDLADTNGFVSGEEWDNERDADPLVMLFS